MKLKTKKGLLWSLVIIIGFTGLMLFGLKQNSNFTPSALIGKSTPEFETNLYPIGKFSSEALLSSSSWKVVNFWASTCYICRLEAEEFQNFYNNVSLLSDEAPQLISINIQENVETIGAWQKQYAQTFPVLMDKDGHISILFGVTGTPETFFVDPEGIVRYRIAGEVNTNFILNFIKWFNTHPDASEKDARIQFVETT